MLRCSRRTNDPARCLGPSPTARTRSASRSTTWTPSSTPEISSLRRQSLSLTGEGLVETAWAADGTLEAIEDPSGRFTLGVQWHPEAGEDSALFETLVEEARK
ncbi:MAG: gamma-glutamyl-gamma-aminobutyrate hydrolase family protein [Thermoleophilia bacterium]|nr:gamma-glutamyl-gamma-aminobutyrate hydrolase family protein [Thermoleophilia bacterium]MDH4339844.1 gamma-glutamyl-gamma-aminobutyrate hydrolase family protein [Thermoleophilia bacterium]MDH5281013.1 gamma-glutamyl-gamma-aminobutyrate hydrolase family protein [Thermoleophilia bacterium]